MVGAAMVRSKGNMGLRDCEGEYTDIYFRQYLVLRNGGGQRERRKHRIWKGIADLLFM